MSHQTDINEKMRGILIDWLIEVRISLDVRWSQQSGLNMLCKVLRDLNVLCLMQVHYKLELLGETLFLTVNIIDRYLARENVLRKKLQLVGVTAMLLACKYEEVSVPVVEDLILICDRAYTRADILEMVPIMRLHLFDTMQIKSCIFRALTLGLYRREQLWTGSSSTCRFRPRTAS